MTNPIDVVKQTLKAFGASAGTQGQAPEVAAAVQSKPDTTAIPETLMWTEDSALKQAQKSGIIGFDPTKVSTSTGVTINPLTNAVTAAGNINYTNNNYALDFISGNLKPDQDKYKKPIIVDGRTNTQVFIIGDPSNPGQYIKTDPINAVNTIINQYAKTAGGIKQLKQLLYSKSYLTGSAAKTSIAAGNLIDTALWQAVYRAAATATFSNYTNGTTMGANNFISFAGVLAGPATVAGTKTSTSYLLTRKDVATADMAASVREYLGRAATPKEIADYVTQLSELEKSRPTVAKVTRDALGAETKRVETAGGVTQEQKTALQVAIIAKSLQAKGVDPATISKSGGKISQTMDILKQNAASYGLQFDDKMALDAAVKSIQPGADYKTEIEKMKQVAKVKYKNLSSAIDAGTTVMDVADQFQKYKNTILELAGPTNVFDPDIQKALNNDGKANVMSVTDFTKLMRSKPEWANTVNAREEAANYATTILKQFGFLG